MPIVDSSYHAKHLFKNGHFSTIYSALFKKVRGHFQKRERITLNDGDFLDLDWSYSKTKTNKLLIALHGLEGSADRSYITGTASTFNKHAVDALCVNFRGCSGTPNNNYRSYHSGATDDLVEVLTYVIGLNKYDNIYLIGFSLGGNLLLKYLGEGHRIPHQIKSAMAVSVPVDLNGSCIELHKPKNWIYAKEFLKPLKVKLKQKQVQFPDRISLETINTIKSLKDFDNTYTALAHGYADAEDYYKKCSSLQYLKQIAIPTLLLNAQNDSFLSETCFPYDIAKHSRHLYLEVPKFGGHVGFYDSSGIYYYEKRAIEFLLNW